MSGSPRLRLADRGAVALGRLMPLCTLVPVRTL